MRRVVVIVAAVLGLVLTGCSPDPQPAAGEPGQTSVAVDTPELRAAKAEAGIERCRAGRGSVSELPQLTLSCLGGGPDVDLSSLEGPVLVNLWWSGCGPCRREMPALQEFHQQYGDEVRVIGVDVENYPGAAIEFAGEAGATYPQLADPGGYVLEAFERPIPGFPHSIVVDESGVIGNQGSVPLDTLSDVEEFVRAGGVSL